MTAKTIFIVIVTALITVIFMINLDTPLSLNLLFWEVNTSASVFLLGIVVVSFLVGYIVGHTKGKKKKLKEKVVVKETPAEPAPPPVNPDDENYIR